MFADPFGLDEQVPERWMLSVGGQRLQHDLGVTRELDVTSYRRSVCNRHSPNFRCIVRRYDHFHHRVHVAVPTMKLYPVARECNTITIRVDRYGLMRGAPHPASGYVLYIDPLTIVVTRCIAPPPRHDDIAIATVTTPGVTYHRGVRNISQQCDRWLRRVCRIRLAHRWFRSFGRNHRDRLILVTGTLDDETSRYAFLQHEIVGPHKWIGVETPLPYLSLQRVRQSNEAHSDVVGHVGPDHGARGTRQWTRVVDRVTEAVRPERSLALQYRQITQSLTRLDKHCQHRCVRCDNKVLIQPALERKIRNTEPTVLIDLISVPNIVGGLGYAPRNLPLHSIQYLASYGPMVCLIQQCERIRLRHQDRHQVL